MYHDKACMKQDGSPTPCLAYHSAEWQKCGSCQTMYRQAPQVAHLTCTACYYMRKSSTTLHITSERYHPLLPCLRAKASSATEVRHLGNIPSSSEIRSSWTQRLTYFITLIPMKSNTLFRLPSACLSSLSWRAHVKTPRVLRQYGFIHATWVCYIAV